MKRVLVKKVSHFKAILILGTALLVPAAAIAAGWATYNYIQKKNYKNFVKFGKTEELISSSTPLSAKDFAKEMETLPLREKYKQYSPSQIFHLASDKKSAINLIDIFDLSAFAKKYPNIKVNSFLITSDLAANNSIATAQELKNVLFTAVDNVTDEIYSSVVNISGFGAAQLSRVPVFSVDENKSKLVYNNTDPSTNILPSVLASEIQKYYNSSNENFSQTISHFGSMQLIDKSGNIITIPSELRLDFAKNSDNQIDFENISDNDGTILVSINILDGTNKVGEFKLQITNLNYYKLALEEFTKLTSNVNEDHNAVKIVPEKQREIALSQKNLSTFFKVGQDVTNFFDFSILKHYFKHLNPSFRAEIEETNFRLDKLGEIKVRAIVDFKNSLKSTTPSQQTESSTSNVKPIAVQAVADTNDDSEQEDENSQSHFFSFNFKVFSNYAQDFLNAVVENNNYFVVRPEAKYINGLDIISRLENMNVAYYAFLQNITLPKGFAVVSLTGASDYDSLTIQQAIVYWVEHIFDKVIDFPEWKKSVKEKIIDPSTGLEIENKASKALAKIFSSLNNIINQNGLKKDKVNYNLSFDNKSQQLTIGISIYNDKNERVATQSVVIAGFAPSLPALDIVKSTGSDLFFDGAALKTIDNVDQTSQVKGSKLVLPSLLNSNFVFEAKAGSAIQVNDANGFNGVSLDSGELTLTNNTPKPEPKPSTTTVTQPVAQQTNQVTVKNPSFGIVFSQDNSLENDKPKIILEEKAQTQTSAMQTTTTQDSYVLFVEKVSNKTEIEKLENISNHKIDTSKITGAAWIIGFGNKGNINSLSQASGSGTINDKVEILAAFPITEGFDTKSTTTFILTIDRNDDKIKISSAMFDGKNIDKQTPFELDNNPPLTAINLLSNLGKSNSSIIIGTTSATVPPSPTTVASPVNSNPTQTAVSKTTLHSLMFYNHLETPKTTLVPQSSQASTNPAIKDDLNSVFESLVNSYTK